MVEAIPVIGETTTLGDSSDREVIQRALEVKQSAQLLNLPIQAALDAIIYAKLLQSTR